MTESEVDLMPQEPETMAIRRPERYDWPGSDAERPQAAPGVADTASRGSTPAPRHSVAAERPLAASEVPPYLEAAGEVARRRMAEVVLEVWRAEPEEGETCDFFQRVARAADAAGLLRPSPAEDLEFELLRAGLAARDFGDRLVAEVDRLSGRYWWAALWGFVTRKQRQAEWAHRYPVLAEFTKALRKRKGQAR